MGKFDLINVSIDGEAITARPVAWSEDTPIKYQTTCVRCSQLIEFDGCEFICPTCGVYGQAQQVIAQPDQALLQIPTLKNAAAFTEQIIDRNPIVDPIVNGAFATDNIDVDQILRE
jgi:hypothetical protein